MNNLLYIGIILFLIGFLIMVLVFINFKIRKFMEQLQFCFEPLISPKNRIFKQTSKDAHESVKESKETSYIKILEAYRHSPNGLTSEECSIKANISYESAHKRIPELISQQKLYNTGITRKNKSGRSAEIRKYVNV